MYICTLNVFVYVLWTISAIKDLFINFKYTFTNVDVRASVLNMQNVVSCYTCVLIKFCQFTCTHKLGMNDKKKITIKL